MLEPALPAARPRHPPASLKFTLLSRRIAGPGRHVMQDSILTNIIIVLQSVWAAESMNICDSYAPARTASAYAFADGVPMVGAGLLTGAAAVTEAGVALSAFGSCCVMLCC